MAFTPYHVDGSESFGAKVGSKLGGFNHEDSSALANVTPGSSEAKTMWGQVEAQAHSPAAVAKAKAAGFSDAQGWYDGRPLIDGQGGHTWQMKVDRLHYCQGLDWGVAKTIASKATQNLSRG